MLILALTAFLLIGAPAALLILNRFVERATRHPRQPKQPPMQTQDEAGTAWFHRPMRPAFRQVPQPED